MFSAKGTDCHFLHCAKSNQKAHQRFANLWTPGTIQSSAGSEFAKFSGGFCRNRFCPQNGGVKALNRCEVRALQRKELERTSKERPYSLQTVGYGWVRMGDGGRKRIVLNGDKERFVQNRKLLVYGNGKFLRTAKKGLCRRKALGLCKSVVFEGNSQGFLKIKNFLVCKSR